MNPGPRFQRLNVLVTGAGAPGIMGTLHCLRHNPDHAVVNVTGVDISADPAGRYSVDSFYQVPAPECDDYTDALLGICEAEHVRLIVPQTTREIPRLAKDRAIFDRHGVRVMVADAGVINRANDKVATLRAFESVGLPVPGFRVADTPGAVMTAASQFGYPDNPVVIKLPVSNGMRGLRVLQEQAQSFDDFASKKPEPGSMSLNEFLRIYRSGTGSARIMVCEYLPGDEYSVDAFREGEFTIAVPRRRTVIRSGISFVTDVDLDQEIIDQSLRGAAALSIEGTFGFQFKRDAEGRPRLLECNPRIQGTMVASAIAGANVIWMGVRWALGLPTEPPGSIRDGTRFSRYWGGVSQVGGSTIHI